MCTSLTRKRRGPSLARQACAGATRSVADWRFHAERRNEETRSGEGLFEVVLKVRQVFDSDAEADDPIVDAPRLTNLRRDAGVGHGRGMADQRFDAAETFCEAENLGAG